MLPGGSEPKTLAGEPPQTYALDRAATGVGYRENVWNVKSSAPIGIGCLSEKIC
jgi:hypothetical protein